MKGGRYLPMSIPRIRLGLDSISYCYPPIEGIPTTEVDLGLNSKGLSYYIRSGGASPSLGQVKMTTRGEREEKEKGREREEKERESEGERGILKREKEREGGREIESWRDERERMRWL
eukprot:1390222-Amorphochlora_amoeboformis.AAC.1